MKLTVKEFVGFYSWLISDEYPKSWGTNWYMDDVYVHSSFENSINEGYNSDEEMLAFIAQRPADEFLEVGFDILIRGGGLNERCVGYEDIAYKEYQNFLQSPKGTKTFKITLPVSLEDSFLDWVASQNNADIKVGV